MMTACVQQNNTYPVEIFSEMHYNQAQKSQEPPRVPAHPDSVTFSEIGSEKELDMSSNPANNYDESYLYEVNCTFSVMGQMEMELDLLLVKYLQKKIIGIK